MEENLNLLVESDDIREDERALFRLDSILATIGVEEEGEIADILSRRRGDPSRAQTEILKVIRAHVERLGGSGTRHHHQHAAGPAQSSSSASTHRWARDGVNCAGRFIYIPR